MSESMTIRYGILGCAERAKKVSKAILEAPNSTLSAIGSRSLDKAKEYAKANEFPPSTKVYGSYDEVLDDPDVDAVYIPLPTSMRLHWAVKAAEKKKHVLIEKPAALTVEEVDKILSACECNGVQFMDGTMWLHHPRTKAVHEFLSDRQRFGQLKEVQSSLTWQVDENFLKNDIRVKPDLDGLGALGDAGWYCIGASLLATDYELPNYVTAQNNAVKNEAGVILSCDASLQWMTVAQHSASFRCSFISAWSMGMTVTGTNETLHVFDYVIPFKNDVASYSTKPTTVSSTKTETKGETVSHVVKSEFPQEVLMIKEFSTLVDGIKRLGLPTDKKWATICRKIHIVIDAVLASINKGGEKVEIH